jgi:Flavin-binding monooxygenase-like
VRFADGSEVEADIVVYCTGYKVTFPFFDEGFISAPDNDLPLFRRTFHPDIPNVFFVGLMQPWGAIMPIAEAQGEWISDHLSGRYALPAPADLRADMEDERRRMFKRYVASKRHTMQVDYDDWMAALAKERKAGAERARLRGHALPVPARASAPVAA